MLRHGRQRAGVLFEPLMVRVVRRHRIKMTAVAGRATALGETNCFGIAPTFGFDVAVGESKRAAVIMFSARAMIKPCAAVKEKGRLADIQRCAIDEGEILTRIVASEIRLLPKGDAIVGKLAAFRRLPIEKAVQRITPDLAMRHTKPGRFITIRRAFVNPHTAQIIGKQRVFGIQQIIHIGEIARHVMLPADDPELCVRCRSVDLPVGDECAGVVIRINLKREGELSLIAYTLRLIRFRFGLVQRWQQQRGEDGDDGNDDEKFDQSETTIGSGNNGASTTEGPRFHLEVGNMTARIWQNANRLTDSLGRPRICFNRCAEPSLDSNAARLLEYQRAF